MPPAPRRATGDGWIAGDAAHDHDHDRPAPRARRRPRTAFAVLAALSVCHLLNDTIQSLLPAIYPVLQQNYLLTFTQIGVIHLVFQVHRLAAAAGGRALYRQAADVPALDLRHGREPPRPRHPRLRHALLGAAGRGGLDRRRVVDLPSRQQPCRAHRLGRALRLRAVVLPGRRQHRLGARAAARGLRGAAVRAVEHRLVLGARAPRDGAALERRDLGARRSTRAAAAPAAAPRSRRCRTGGCCS